MAVDIGALQRAHPTWNIVDAITAPNGGIWAVGADGGVFSLDAQGGTSGTTAPFFGAYTQLDPAQRQGTRSFVAIQADPATGGYTLISNQPGQTYNFRGDKPIGQAVDAAAQPAPTAGIDFNDADLNRLTGMLNQFGLGDLVDTAWNYYKDPKGAAGDAQAVLDFLPTTQQYKDHFPGLTEMAEQGRAWTPAQWNAYYNNAQDQALSAGLPPGYLDRADIGKLITSGVSAGELQGRIQAAGAAVYQADPDLIAQMRDYGFTDGDLTAFFLDPDKAAPLLESKAKVEQAGIGAAARHAGYELGLSTAQQLQQQGVDVAAATEGFTRLGTMHPLFENTVGESAAGESITTDEQLNAQFGNDVAAQQEITRRRTTRQAEFQGGGGAAGGGGGRTGLG